MQVLNNTPAFNVWKNYSENVANLRGSMSKLSSGLKIQTATDDPAGLAISQRLRAQAGNSAAAEQNIQNALSYSQTADSWLQKVHDILGRMGDLAVSASDGTKSSTDVDNLKVEFGQMQAELVSIAQSSTYNTKKLFDGSDISLQIGPDTGQAFTLNKMLVSSALGTVGNDSSGNPAGGVGVLLDNLKTPAHLAGAVADVNAAVDGISSIRATLGAQSARLQVVLSGVTTYESNVRGAESQIRDVDMAKEATSFSKYQILSNVGTAMMAQANNLPQSVLKLIQ